MQIQTLYVAYADKYKVEYIILHRTVPTIHLAESLKLSSNSSVYTKVMPFCRKFVVESPRMLETHECSINC